MRDHERSHGVAFDTVFKVRPDLSFVDPMPPFCKWNRGVACLARDWLFMLPGDTGPDALRAGFAAFTVCDHMMWPRILEAWNNQGIGKALRGDQKSARPPATSHPDAWAARVRVVRPPGVMGNTDSALDPAKCI